MILFLLAQVTTVDSTPGEQAFCSGPRSDQPYRFCLADRKYERAQRNLTAALSKARMAAAAQKLEIARFSRSNGGVTLAGDPVLALNAAQRVWTRSYKADCVVLSLAVATGNAGTEGVTTQSNCEADRIFERARFLRQAYSAGG